MRSRSPRCIAGRGAAPPHLDREQMLSCSGAAAGRRVQQPRFHVRVAVSVGSLRREDRAYWCGSQMPRGLVANLAGALRRGHRDPDFTQELPRKLLPRTAKEGQSR